MGKKHDFIEIIFNHRHKNKMRIKIIINTIFITPKFQHQKLPSLNQIMMSIRMNKTITKNLRKLRQGKRLT